jgi:DNA polymerase epsilon subunit 1
MRQEVRPHIFVTYNGDNFDWPFVERRAQIRGYKLCVHGLLH